jgi:D-tyrosyl-tRNA(Tyr) deacylase
MRAVVQRVSEATVSVDGIVVGAIRRGLAVLLGIGRGDGESEAQWIANKIVHLRIFEDDDGKFNRSLLDTGGAVLLVSQFTLYGDARKGRRPSFTSAAPPDYAQPLVERVAALIRQTGASVECGQFQVHMLVNIRNDGPVTIILQREPDPSGTHLSGSPVTGNL